MTFLWSALQCFCADTQHGVHQGQAVYPLLHVTSLDGEHVHNPFSRPALSAWCGVLTMVPLHATEPQAFLLLSHCSSCLLASPSIPAPASPQHCQPLFPPLHIFI